MTFPALSIVLALGISSLAASASFAESVAPFTPTTPASTDSIAALSDILQIGSIIDVMREEGIVYGRQMEDELLAGRGGAGWQAMVAIVYDAGVMRTRFDAAFATALDGSPHVTEITDFFGSDIGQRVLRLEIEARRALLDPAVEEAAKAAYADMKASDDPRLAGLQAFVETNDLIESNVMGALNANLAFYQGMAEVVGAQEALPEDQMLAEVWAQEPEVRAETVDWLYPYLALAYKPLSDADLAAYQAFSDSPAGQAVNAALFAAFDVVFVAVSKDLGQAAARQMQGQEL